MTQEEIIKKNAEGCAKYFDGYRKLEFLEDCLNNLYEPKERTIVATRIRDRQFQHALVDEVAYHQLVNSFITDSSACLRGRGVDYCLNRTTKHLVSYFRKHGSDGWVYKFDIKNYFQSISHDLAKRIVQKRIKDRRVQTELFRIIDSKMHFFDSALKRNADNGRKKLVKVSGNVHIDGMAAFLDAMTVRQKWYSEIGNQLKNSAG